MPKGVPFKSDIERLEANRKRSREWQRKNKEKTKIYRNKEEVKEKKRERDRKYKAEKRKDPEFKTKEVEIQKRYYNKNKDKIRKNVKDRYKVDEEYQIKVKTNNKKSYLKNKKKYLEKAREKWAKDSSYRNNLIEKMKSWQSKNKEHIIEYRKSTRAKASKYERDKTKNDPIYRMAKNLRARIRDIIKRNLKAGIEITKTSTTQENLGCNFNKFKEYIESKWLPNMSWKNYGSKGWHIDHIIPAGIIDLTVKENEKYISNYQNLQPLWAKDNQKKNSNIKKIFPLNCSEKIIGEWINELKRKLRKDLKFRINQLSDGKNKIVEVSPIFYD